jgi:hypothetical protein
VNSPGRWTRWSRTRKRACCRSSGPRLSGRQCSRADRSNSVHCWASIWRLKLRSSQVALSPRPTECSGQRPASSVQLTTATVTPGAAVPARANLGRAARELGSRAPFRADLLVCRRPLLLLLVFFHFPDEALGPHISPILLNEVEGRRAEPAGMQRTQRTRPAAVLPGCGSLCWSSVMAASSTASGSRLRPPPYSVPGRWPHGRIVSASCSG